MAGRLKQDIRYAVRIARRTPGFSITPADPVSVAAGVVVLLVVAAVASDLPARRATGWIRWRH